MKTTQVALTVLSLSMLTFLLPGCGSGSDQPELGLVTGTITMDGEPLQGIAVVFQPDNGRPAYGKTDSTGKYELTYIRNTRGTKVGHNRVEIATSEEGEEDTEEELGDDEESTGGGQKSFERKKVKIPVRYNLKSELEADVQPGENVFDFQLTSKPKA
ncbi:hypothetical protein GC163_06920 [bacterium]|nr:hypothetical protein [bacterium]